MSERNFVDLQARLRASGGMVGCGRLEQNDGCGDNAAGRLCSDCGDGPGDDGGQDEQDDGCGAGSAAGSTVRWIEIDRLVAHPDNPNRMSRANFTKLRRHIERTGRYEPLVVRPAPERPGYYQILNGHHRWQVLKQLGYERVLAVVWDVDDGEALLALATLNRLCGRDELGGKVALLRRLAERYGSGQLGKWLPYRAGQIDRLLQLQLPRGPVRVEAEPAVPMVFFVNDRQKATIERALEQADTVATGAGSRASRRAAALTAVAEAYLQRRSQRWQAAGPGGICLPVSRGGAIMAGGSSQQLGPG